MVQNHRMACCTEMNMVPNCNCFTHAASRTLLDKVVEDVDYPDSDDDGTEAGVEFKLQIRQQKRRNTLERRRKHRYMVRGRLALCNWPWWPDVKISARQPIERSIGVPTSTLASKQVREMINGTGHHHEWFRNFIADPRDMLSSA